MNKIFLIIMILSFSILIANNPSSENYVLQQKSFATGSDPATQPTSENYILTGSHMGIISDTAVSSQNYDILPGYYLGPIIGEILPPQNVTISVVGDNVSLSWDAVAAAGSYQIYSSGDPHEDFENWTLEATGIAATSWSQPLPDTKKFYCVVASTQSATRTGDMPNQNDRNSKSKKKR